MLKRLSLPLMAGLGLVAVGCDPGDTSPEAHPAAAIKVKVEAPTAQAGLVADIDNSPTAAVMEQAKKRTWVARRDAFALLPIEAAYDKSQMSARLISEGGGFSNFFVVPETTEEAPVVTEPLPLWRLSGVVIGDGVAALLDMGTKVIDIRPGMKIPDTQWVVVSIDSERAVLRREGNTLPHEFVVPLQGAAPGRGAAGRPGGATGSKGGPAGAGGGQPGGGRVAGVGD